MPGGQGQSDIDPENLDKCSGPVKFVWKFNPPVLSEE